MADWINPAPYPIIYVRGYAMTRGEIDATTADPFCGFNIGSTVFRATADRSKPPRKFMFESPVLRLAKDYGYQDVFLDGADLTELPPAAVGIPQRSIVVHRYYDPASTLLGNGETPGIEDFASALSQLIARVRDLTAVGADKVAADRFRCYLVAHSMGGLVCRAFLQNPGCDPHGVRATVDKFFTYATPHNGIDMAGINVPSWLTANDISNFNREAMARYLAIDADLYKRTKRVDWMPEGALPSRRVFCLVGSNRSDYEPAMGLSRSFSGHGSDGLVRIENAVVCSADGDATSQPTAKAFVYRSHSGYFGIVNSEEAFQNLTRFLFGDLRVDVWLDIDDITLPATILREANGKRIDALYQIELLAAARGKPWYLTRRVAEEDSVACLRHQDWEANPNTGRLHLSTVFLSGRFRTDPTQPALSYIVTVGVRVPDYEVEGALWMKHHYEGSYLFYGSILVAVTPPMGTDGWKVRYDWQTDSVHEPSTPLDGEPQEDGTLVLRIPLPPRAQNVTPSVSGHVRFVVSTWNDATAGR